MLRLHIDVLSKKKCYINIEIIIIIIIVFCLFVITHGSL